MRFLFVDRIDAGRRQAEHLTHLQDRDVVVVGLPRVINTDVVVAARVSRST